MGWLVDTPRRFRGGLVDLVVSLGKSLRGTQNTKPMLFLSDTRNLALTQAYTHSNNHFHYGSNLSTAIDH